RHGHAVAANDDAAFELGDVLDLLAHRGVADVALRMTVAAEGVEVHRPRHRQHLSGIADDEHGTDRVPFAPLPSDLRGQLDDGPPRLQRHLRVEPAQVLRTQPLQVFPQVNDTETVYGFGVLLADLDAVVQSDDVRALVQLVGADGFEQGQAHPLLRRRRSRVNVEDGEVGVDL